MRETRLSGSEGGAAQQCAVPTPIGRGNCLIEAEPRSAASVLFPHALNSIVRLASRPLAISRTTAVAVCWPAASSGSASR